MRRWVALGLLLFTFGCGGTSLSYSPTAPPPRKLKKKSPEKVAIYTTSTPRRSYVEIGILEAQQESNWRSHDIKGIIGKMREAAGKLGCDALVVLGSNNAATGGAFTTTVKGYRASCVVYRSTKRHGKKKARVASSACVPGSTQLCHGPAACQGAQACLPDGSGFDRCDCGTNAGIDAQTVEPTPYKPTP